MKYYEWQYLLYEQIEISFMIDIVSESLFYFSLKIWTGMPWFFFDMNFKLLPFLEKGT